MPLVWQVGTLFINVLSTFWASTVDYDYVSPLPKTRWRSKEFVAQKKNSRHSGMLR